MLPRSPVDPTSEGTSFSDSRRFGIRSANVASGFSAGKISDEPKLCGMDCVGEARWTDGPEYWLPAKLSDTRGDTRT
jgi:hypothetical protein